MAAVSTASTTTTTTTAITAAATALTPPSSSHGNGFTWESSSQQLEDGAYDQKRLLKPQASQAAQTGSSSAYNAFDFAPEQPVYEKFSTPRESSASVQKTASHVSPHYGPDTARTGRLKETNGGLADSAMELHETRNGAVFDSNKRPAAIESQGKDLDDNSKWIHRDKLARIENEELQAAGIIIPKSRARSKPRRDTAADKAAGYRKAGMESSSPGEPRARKNSDGILDGKLSDAAVPSWDLRLPEEIAATSYFAPPSGAKGVSRIPVAKQSPVPIPLEHMERDVRTARKRDDSPGAEDSIVYPKTRSRSASARARDGNAAPPPASPQRNPVRSASDLSPKKLAGISNGSSNGGSTSGSTSGSSGAPTSATSNLRKTSAPTKTSSTSGRPKTRSGTSKDSNNSSTGPTRPPTRSGERELSREFAPGAASKQPEGEPPWMISAYRPDPRLPPDQQLLPTVAKRLQQEKWEREGKFGNIYDKEFRPLTDEGFLSPPPEATEKPPAATETTSKPERQGEWPLKPRDRSPTLPQGRTGSYSTIPKIQDKPNASPLPSPRGPMHQTAHAAGAVRPSQPLDEDEAEKKGCGCCIVM
ncbi:hypothetical protein SPI_08591 [Niveomyces insectorum RCEF 264]|uniref:TeaA receptor TeaR n=1 Tax=Niveomyces insectorum RCEF 264 TaxID=1081102 RepID=A0A162MDS3_9HYPO|nr:hypothetical protein SPI_08591 [Niveomyces insectorum RCEF 264]